MNYQNHTVQVSHQPESDPDLELHQRILGGFEGMHAAKANVFSPAALACCKQYPLSPEDA
jgi:hypothetical protein